MNKVVEILIERDKMTKENAEKRIAETREEIYEAMDAGDIDYVEDILMDELGLEMDYIFDVL